MRIKEDEPRIWCANIMGHAGTQTTEKYYVHLRKEDNAQAMEKVASGLRFVPHLVPAEKDTA